MADAAPDAAAARARAEHARSEVDAANRQVTALEGGKTSPDDLQKARQHRSQLVQAWRREADAWAQAAPRDKAAKDAVTASKDAQEAYYMPSGGLVRPATPQR